METYAAHIVDGTVTQVIVGDPAWAETNLGGVWVETDTLVGIGWTYTVGTFIAPVYPDAAEEDMP